MEKFCQKKVILCWNFIVSHGNEENSTSYLKDFYFSLNLLVIKTNVCVTMQTYML